MRRAFLLLNVLLFNTLPPPAPAQDFRKELYSLQIIRSGTPIDHPFTGGFTNPGHQFADMDGDGDLDLTVLDMSDDALFYFRNEGTSGDPVFRQDETAAFFPPLRNWFRISDVTGDGLADLLSAGEAANSIALYRNSGTSTAPAFTLVTPSLRTTTDTLVLALLFSIPALTDIDNDGDVDFFSLNAGIGTINYYENVGGAMDFRLAFRSDFFQNIRICPGCGGTPHYQLSELHGNGAMEFADVDGNGTKDMFYGDLFDTGLFFYRNSGTPENVKLDSVAGNFPASSPVQSVGYNQATLADVDGDGDTDLFVSVLHSSVQTDNFWFYRNAGSPTQYEYILTTKNFLPTFDVGTQSAPALADIDNDGDMDLCVGDLLGRVYLLRNTGSRTRAEFTIEDSNYVGLANRFAYVPRFGDLDGDGDQDLILGHFGGNVDFFRNTGTPGFPQFTYEQSFFDSVNVGLYASPDLFDIDGDGDLDFFVGSAGGTVRFYRNEGSASSWNFVLVSNALGGINVGPNAKPVLGDIDGDGDGDLVIGSSDGALSVFQNDGTFSNPLFTPAGEALVLEGLRRETVPVLGDIDGDGDLDLLVGNSRGGLEFFRHTQSTSVRGGQSIPQRISLSHYPNPFNPTTTITFGLPYDGEVSLDIFDTIGRKVAGLIDGRHRAGRYDVKFDASKLAGGVYFYRILTERETYIGKMIVLR
jgi:FG-GAP-like repeat/Secretion system C-terminal sorting domain